MLDTSTIILYCAIFLFVAHLIVIKLFAWGGIFRKAGYHPAMLFIPVYGLFLCYKIAESEKLFFLKIMVSFFAYLVVEVIVGPYSIGNSAYPQGVMVALLILSAIVGTVFLVFNFFFCINLSRLFGKGGTAAAGFLCLFPVFFSMLGFGDAEYAGYGGRYSRNYLAENNTWTCPECGEKIPAHKASCTCGATKPRE